MILQKLAVVCLLFAIFASGCKDDNSSSTSKSLKKMKKIQKCLFHFYHTHKDSLRYAMMRKFKKMPIG